MSVSESKLLAERQGDYFRSTAFQEWSKKINRVAIVKSMWYPEVIEGLVQSAKATFFENKIEEERIQLVNASGALEIPLLTKKLLSLEEIDLVVTLGCVLEGQTPHFEFVCHECFRALGQVQIDLEKAVGIGILTVSNIEQAMERRQKGREAAEAALMSSFELSMINSIRGDRRAK